jgi:REP element-mobilizing transposase RayT
MASSKQQKFSFVGKQETQHGGEYRKGKRKDARPIDPKRPIHLTLRSSQANGKRSMLHPENVKRTESLVRKIAKKRQLRVYRYVNVGNHLHLILKTPTRFHFQTFLRELAGSLAMMITGAGKGRALAGRFWDQLAWTRIVNWGKDFQGLCRYFIKNIFESQGLYSKAQRAAGWRVIALAFDSPPG